MVKKLLLVVAAAISLGAANNSHAFFGFGSDGGSSSPVFPERGADLGSPSFTTEKVNKTPVLMGNNYLKYLDSVSCLEPNASMPWNTRLINYINPSAIKCDVKPPAYQEKASVSVSEKKGVKYVRIISSGPDWDGKAWVQRQFDESLFAYNPETGYMVGVTYENLFGDNESVKQQFSSKQTDFCDSTDRNCNFKTYSDGNDGISPPIAWYALETTKTLTNADLADLSYDLRRDINRGKITENARYAPIKGLDNGFPLLQMYSGQREGFVVPCEETGKNNQFCRVFNYGKLKGTGRRSFNHKDIAGDHSQKTMMEFVFATKLGVSYKWKHLTQDVVTDVQSKDEDGDVVVKKVRSSEKAEDTPFNRLAVKAQKKDPSYNFGSNLYILDGWTFQEGKKQNNESIPEQSVVDAIKKNMSDASNIGLPVQQVKDKMRQGKPVKCNNNYNELSVNPDGTTKIIPVVHKCKISGALVYFDLDVKGNVVKIRNW